MQGSKRSEERRNDDVNDAPNTTTNTHEEERWNHFTAPLTQEPLSHKRYEAPSSSSSSTPTSDLLSTPSVFSDLERSQTVDRFSTIFMERMEEAMSSGKLSKAWQSSSSGVAGDVVGIGSSLFSWMFTDHTPDHANLNTNQGYYTTKTINPADYASEKRMIEPHFTPFVWGSSCMMVTLFSLRLGRWYQGGGQAVGRTLTNSVNRTTSNHAQRTATTTNNNLKSLKDVRHAQHHQSHSIRGGGGGNSGPFNSTRKKELTNELMASLNTVPVDMALSMLIGISTTIFLTSPSNLMKDLSDAPLVEGKSALAEELCLPFGEEMRNMNGLYHTYTIYNANNTGNGNRNDNMPAQRQVVPYSNLWKEENLGDFDSLRSIRDFVLNCHEREEFAKRTIAPDSDTALSEQELLELKIPPPGISPNI